MAQQTLGRTNRDFPPIWLRLCVPRTSSSIEELVDAALEAETVLDVSTQPALWGGRLRHSDSMLMASGGLEIEDAHNDTLAANLVQACILQTLSAVGHESIEFYFLRVRRALEEYQIAGALEALESSKQEGCIKHLGLLADGPGLAVKATWQFHDAFEVILLKAEELSILSALAHERRVGIVLDGPSSLVDVTALIPVESAAQVRETSFPRAVTK